MARHESVGVGQKAFRLAALAAFLFGCASSPSATLASNGPHNIGKTPAAAFSESMHVAPKRVNSAGNYATLVADVAFEGPASKETILVQKFGFGWQTITMLKSACQLRIRHLSAETARTLLMGSSIPFGTYGNPCEATGDQVDSGPAQDIESIRRLNGDSLFLSAVIVSGNHALAFRFGGTALLSNDHGWKTVMGGGGAIDGASMEQHGVPLGEICHFPIPSKPACP